MFPSVSSPPACSRTAEQGVRIRLWKGGNSGHRCNFKFSKNCQPEKKGTGTATCSSTACENGSLRICRNIALQQIQASTSFFVQIQFWKNISFCCQTQMSWTLLKELFWESRQWDHCEQQSSELRVSKRSSQGMLDASMTGDISRQNKYRDKYAGYRETTFM